MSEDDPYGFLSEFEDDAIFRGITADDIVEPVTPEAKFVIDPMVENELEVTIAGVTFNRSLAAPRNIALIIFGAFIILVIASQIADILLLPLLFTVAVVVFAITVAIIGLDRRRTARDMASLLTETNQDLQRAFAKAVLFTLKGTKRDRSFQGLLDRANDKTNLGVWALTRVVAPVSVGLALFLVRGNLLFLLSAVLPPLSAVGSLAWKARQRVKKFDGALPTLLDAMAGALKAGATFPQAFSEAVTSSSIEPISTELGRTIPQIQAGGDAAELWLEVAERMRSEGMTFATQAYKINKATGGSMHQALGNAANMVRESQVLESRISAASAQARLSAIVLMLVPLGIAGYISVTVPSFIEEFNSPIGFVLIGISFLGWIAGGFWMKNLTTFKD